MAHSSPTDPTARLLGHSPAIQALRAQIHHLAAFDTLSNPHVPTLLLQGETGTGKGLVARVMHDSGPRAAGPFVDVNCAAIPDTLLEAELFGYEAGAFSEAKRAKPGLFEAASGGTLFLDEIDALPLTLQTKLLTVIEAKRVRRLGAVREQAVDVKLIAAAQADLSALVETGRFRADLYHRLAVVVLALPPLRARGEDVVVLAQAHLQRYAAAHRRPPKRLSPGAEAWLRGHRWPGNVRELSHLMERVTLLSEEPLVGAGTLARLSLPSGEPSPSIGATPPTEADSPPDEATRIRQALQDVGGNVVQAARRLGLSRSGLRYRMQRHGIEPPARGTGPSPRPLRPAPPSPPQEGEGPLPADDVPAPAWEQKPVAVLAIDLTFPNTSGPVEPWTVARRWEHAVGEKVRGFGGVVLQRLSSLFAVAFGVPLALEQLPQRAVQAALAVRQLVADAQAAGAGKPVPEVRQAVHLGTMLVETRAGALTERYLAEGESLSVAVRLLGHAAAGELLVSPQIGRLVAGWCEMRARTLPWGAEPPGHLQAYRIEGLVPPHASRTGWAARPFSRFVGRARELALLRERLAQAAGGRGQVVGVVGEAGIGKSRLLYEFRQTLGRQPVMYMEGRCLSYGTLTPYLPVLGMLQAYWGIGEAGDPKVIADKVRGGLEAVGMDPDEGGPYLCHLLSGAPGEGHLADLSPDALKRRTFEAVWQLCLHGSRRQPLILAVEDLHWADPTSEEVLTALVERMSGARILFLATYRPGYTPPWTGKSYVTQLALPPLSDEDSLGVVHSALQTAEVPAPIVRYLLAKAEGNPLFMEELVQALVDQGVFVRGPVGAAVRAEFSSEHSIAEFRLPPTLQAVLAARIDRLLPAEKSLLQTAAVIGPDVPLALLRSVAEAPEALLDPGLTHLQAAEFLYETSPGPDGAYSFKHTLTQQAAYEMLPPNRRRALHARTAAALEASAGDQASLPVERLAHHALQGELWDKALAYLRRVGEKAQARYAHREAARAFEQALDALARLPARRDTQEQAIDLRLALRTALFPSGDLGRIKAYLREAEAMAEALEDPRRLQRVLRLQANDASFTGAYDQAIAAANRALVLTTAGGDVVQQALTHFQLGLAHQARGDYRQAIDYHGRSVAALAGPLRHERFGGLLVPAVLARTDLAACHAEMGTFAQGITLADEACHIAEAVNSPGSLMFAWWASGQVALAQGDLHQALPPLERAIRVCQEADLPTYAPWVAEGLGAAYSRSGRAAEAVPLLTQALEQLRAVQVLVLEARCHLTLGEAQLRIGCPEEAYAQAERALALTRERQERGHQAYALRLLGEVAVRREPPERDQAEAHYCQALALATELGMRPLVAHCHLDLGTLYTTIGRHPQARTELSTAIELYRAMAMGFWLPEAERALAAAEGQKAVGDGFQRLQSST